MVRRNARRLQVLNAYLQRRHRFRCGVLSSRRWGAAPAVEVAERSCSSASPTLEPRAATPCTPVVEAACWLGHGRRAPLLPHTLLGSSSTIVLGGGAEEGWCCGIATVVGAATWEMIGSRVCHRVWGCAGTCAALGRGAPHATASRRGQQVPLSSSRWPPTELENNCDVATPWRTDGSCPCNQTSAVAAQVLSWCTV